MKIRAGEWQKLNRGQKYIILLIAYGYWQSRWGAKRKTPAVGGNRKRALG